MTNNVLIRPGTLFIIALALLVGLGVYNWSEQLFPAAEKETSSESFDCSTLEFDFVGQRDNGTHHTVFVQASKDIEMFAVTFQGPEQNATRVVEEYPARSISEITAPVSPVKSVKATVKGCSRVFRG